MLMLNARALADRLVSDHGSVIVSKLMQWAKADDAIVVSEETPVNVTVFKFSHDFMKDCVPIKVTVGGIVRVSSLTHLEKAPTSILMHVSGIDSEMKPEEEKHSFPISNSFKGQLRIVTSLGQE